MSHWNQIQYTNFVILSDPLRDQLSFLILSFTLFDACTWSDPNH
ncbi:protein of unknown function [Shewanella benthica]|uniref:Uncharacterized protein n=1 Tax=Shewanella benthica TaxID=43661 RepID=A0A330M6D6_9GAMM|nr:protein of unknown function [Shewanella benthica]